MCTLWGPGELRPRERKLPAPFSHVRTPKEARDSGDGDDPGRPATLPCMPGPVTHVLRTLVASPQMPLQVTKSRRGHSIDWITTTHPGPTDVPGTVPVTGDRMGRSSPQVTSSEVSTGPPHHQAGWGGVSGGSRASC